MYMYGTMMIFDVVTLNISVFEPRLLRRVAGPVPVRPVHLCPEGRLGGLLHAGLHHWHLLQVPVLKKWSQKIDRLSYLSVLGQKI